MISHKALSFPQLILQPAALPHFLIILVSSPARTNSPCAVALGWLMALDCTGKEMEGTETHGKLGKRRTVLVMAGQEG